MLNRGDRDIKWTPIPSPAPPHRALRRDIADWMDVRGTPLQAGAHSAEAWTCSLSHLPETFMLTLDHSALIRLINNLSLWPSDSSI